MTLEAIHSALLWAVIINYAILFIWFIVFVRARSWLRNFHGRWFTLSEQQFDGIHYLLMGVYDIAIFMFFLVPYIVLWIVR